jgi:putative transposase
MNTTTSDASTSDASTSDASTSDASTSDASTSDASAAAEAGAASAAAAAGASSAAGAAHPGPGAADGDEFAAVQLAACEELTKLIGRAQACLVTGVPRSSWYRHHRVSPAPPRPAPTPHAERVQPRALSPAERARVRELLNTTYLDDAPATAWAKLLDQGEYHCSISTMYRILREHDEVTERRRQATHPPRSKPELMAAEPNQVWSWDVTKLAGPARGIWYCLYVIIDIFSRYTPGWMIAHTEDGDLARRFLRESITKHRIDPDTLTLHADRGSPQKSKSVAEMLSDLHVTRSHSRPKTSNDNPYSEAQFKTMKYRPVFPDRFDSIEHAREFCGEFFRWYNHDHRHSGIGLHTPASVHFGTATKIRQLRGIVLAEAYTAHPERFVHGTPQPPKLPDTAWINRPTDDTGKQETDVHPDRSTK